MVLKKYYFQLFILHCYFLLSITRETSIIGERIDEDEDKTKKFQTFGSDHIKDLRTDNVDVEKELQEMIEMTLPKYQKIDDFQKKPCMNFVVVLPKDLGENFVPETLKEMIEYMLSNVTITSDNRTQSTKPVDFSMEVRMDKNDTISLQTIKVTFKLTNETLNCLEQKNDVTITKASNLWCSKDLGWNLKKGTRSENINIPPVKKTRKLEALSIIDMSNKNWIEIMKHMFGEEAAGHEKRKKESTKIAINLIAPEDLNREDFLMMLNHIHELANQQIKGIQSVKYLVQPRMHGKKLRNLDMIILLSPLSEEEEETQHNIEKMCIKKLIPHLQQKYKKLSFEYEYVFNAVETDKDSVLENTYRLVLRVHQRNKGPKIASRTIRNMLKEITDDDYKDIGFESCYNDLDYEDRRKDYLILTYKMIEPQFEDTQKFVEKIFKKQILPYLKKTYPDQQLEIKIKGKEVDYPGMYNVDQYKVLIRVLKGEPEKIKPEIIEDLLGKLSKKYTFLNVTCNILESDPINPNLQFLKVCLDIKETTKHFSKPWSSEGKKEFILSDLDGTEYPSGYSPPMKAPTWVDKIYQTTPKEPASTEITVTITTEGNFGKLTETNNENSTLSPVTKSLLDVNATLGDLSWIYSIFQMSTEISTSTESSTIITTQGYTGKENIIENETSILPPVTVSSRQTESTSVVPTGMYEVQPMITKLSTSTEAPANSTIDTQSRMRDFENMVTSTSLAVVEDMRETVSTSADFAGIRGVAKIITEPSTSTEISVIINSEDDRKENVMDKESSTISPIRESLQNRGSTLENLGKSGVISQMSAKLLTSPERFSIISTGKFSSKDYNIDDESSTSFPGINLVGAGEVSEIIAKPITEPSTSTEISMIIASEGDLKENVIEKESSTNSPVRESLQKTDSTLEIFGKSGVVAQMSAKLSSSPESFTIISTGKFSNKDNNIDNESSTSLPRINLALTGEVSEMIAKPSTSLEIFTTIMNQNETVIVTNDLVSSTSPMKPQVNQGIDIATTNLPWTEQTVQLSTVLATSNSKVDSFFRNTSSSFIHNDGIEQTIVADIPGEELVRKILDKEILPFLDVFHQKRNLKTNITRKVENFPGEHCNKETFQVMITDPAGGFSFSMIKMHMLLLKLPEEYSNIATACMSSDENSFMHTITLTICLKDNKSNRTCTIPNGGMERLCCGWEGDLPEVVPVGGSPPLPRETSVPVGGSPPLE